jgi:hypothetical protein
MGSLNSIDETPYLPCNGVVHQLQHFEIWVVGENKPGRSDRSHVGERPPDKVHTLVKPIINET